VPSLADWKETTALPWFGFWARELLRWGTLDPFVAFALAQGHSKTREEAEGLRVAFDEWLVGEIENPGAEDRIDPQRFLAWEKSLPVREPELAEPMPTQVKLTGTRGVRGIYNVLPLAGDGEALWVDAGGFELGRSVDELGLYNSSDLAHDYVLEVRGRATVRRVFARSRRS
jgi:hypothetical protein